MFALDGITVPDNVARAGLSLLATSPGLVASPTHIFSTGYGLSIACLAAHSILSRKDSIGPAGLIQGSLLGLFGARLGGFLFIRSLQDSYKQRDGTKEMQQKMNSMSLWKRAMTWIPCSFIYLLFAEPTQTTVVHGKTSPTNPIFLAGMGIAWTGFLVESVADAQKFALKSKDGNAFCRGGLFSIVRHPAYLGEVLFWIGHLIAGLPALMTNWVRMGMAVIGALFNLQLMIGSSKRLDGRQEEKYGKRRDWQEYRKATPCRMFPGFPSGSD